MSSHDIPHYSSDSERRAEYCVYSNELIRARAQTSEGYTDHRGTYQLIQHSLSDAARLLCTLLRINDVGSRVLPIYNDTSYMTRFMEENPWLRNELKDAWLRTEFRNLLSFSKWLTGM